MRPACAIIHPWPSSTPLIDSPRRRGIYRVSPDPACKRSSLRSGSSCLQPPGRASGQNEQARHSQPQSDALYITAGATGVGYVLGKNGGRGEEHWRSADLLAEALHPALGPSLVKAPTGSHREGQPRHILIFFRRLGPTTQGMMILRSPPAPSPPPPPPPGRGFSGSIGPRWRKESA